MRKSPGLVTSNKIRYSKARGFQAAWIRAAAAEAPAAAAPRLLVISEQNLLQTAGPLLKPDPTALESILYSLSCVHMM